MALDTFPISDLDAVKAVLTGQPLGAASVPKNALVEIPLAADRSFPLGDDLKASLYLAASASVLAFNSLDDQDGDEVLQPDGAALADDALGPALTLTTDRAWLKYRVSGALKAEGGVSLSALGFTLDGSGTVVLADYRVHDRGEPVNRAVLDDLLGKPRFVLAMEHVRALQSQEAVAMRVGGTLGLSLELKWSDVLTAALGPLAGLLADGLSLAVALDAGVALKASVELDDEFIVTVARLGPDFRVGVRRATVRQASGNLSIGLAVSLASDGVSAVVDAVLAGVAGMARTEIGALLAKGLGALSPAELDQVKRLARRLGVLADNNPKLLDALAAAWRALESKVGDTVKDIATSKIAAAFAYEYGRLSSDVDLLRVRGTDGWLATRHGDLVRGRLGGILDDVRAGKEGVLLEQFLRQRTITLERSWGFTLSVGKWLEAGGKDRERLTTTTRSLLDGRQRRSYNGLRSYQGGLGNSTVAWAADLRADMRGFSSGPLPSLSEYDFGLSLTWTSREGTLSAADLEVVLDAAVLWNVIAQDDAPRVRGELQPLLGQVCESVVELTADDDVVRALLARAAGSSFTVLAGPLAAGMPYWGLSDDRVRGARRRELYTDLWQSYLAGAETLPDRLAALAEQHLRAAGAASLGRLESQALFDLARPFTFAGLVALNGDTRAAGQGFHEGLADLHRAIVSGAPDHDVIPRAFARLEPFWTQSHHIRAVGVYLLDGARISQMLRRTRRSLTVSPKQGAAIVIGS